MAQPPRLDSVALQQEILKLWEQGGSQSDEEEGERPDIQAWFIKFEDLQFGSKIDKGSYGAVWRGVYQGTEVAVKEITALNDKEDIFYIDREVRALVQACHPNIVNFLGVCKTDRQVYIVTEYVSNGNIRQWLDKRTFDFSWALRIQIACETAEALLYLHKMNIVHRDVKSKNLLLTEEWQVKLCDFGFARVQDTTGRPMTICGTHAYMAPEITAGGVYDEKADVFSFGICLAEIITRVFPDDGLVKKTPPGGLDVAAFDRLAANDCPPSLFKLALTCCNIEGSNRPSFADITDQLRQIRDGEFGTGSVSDIKSAEVELKEEVGTGPNSRVHLGVYNGTAIAVKVIPYKQDSEVQLQRFEREKNTLIGLRSPNIVQLFGSWSDGENFYIAMEYVPGGSLQTLLGSRNRLMWPERIAIALDVARALHYLHSKGIIHRDLKSSNILLDERGRAKVCEFGLARPVATRRHMTVHSADGVFVAPEIVAGLQYDKQSDVFSFGVILGQLATRRRPEDWLYDDEKGMICGGDGGAQGGSSAKKCVVDAEALYRLAQNACPGELLQTVLACCSPLPKSRPDFQQLLDRLISLTQRHPMEPKRAHCVAGLQRTLSKTLAYTFSDSATTASDFSVMNGDAVVLDAKAASEAVDKFVEGLGKGAETSGGKMSLPVVGAGRSDEIHSCEQMFQLHVDKLVRRATNEDFPDHEFLRHFLLMYPAFVRTKDLLDAFRRRFVDVREDGAHASPRPPACVDASKSWDRKGIIIRLRVVNALKIWVDNFIEDFEDADVIEELCSFVRGDIGAQPSTEKVAKRLLFTIEAKRKRVEAPPSVGGHQKKLQDAPHPLELARQLTAMDAEVFGQMSPRELLYVILHRDSQRTASHVYAMDRRFEEVSTWAIRSILNQRDIKQRVASLSAFIEVAEHLRILKNFGAVFAIMCGLAHPCVQRLVQTWKDLPRTAIRRFGKLKQFVSAEGGFPAYRSAMLNTSPPWMPHLEILLRELESMNRAAPTKLSNGLINFDKLRGMADLMYRCVDAAKVDYRLVDVSWVRQYLVSQLTDEVSRDFIRMSMMCE